VLAPECEHVALDGTGPRPAVARQAVPREVREQQPGLQANRSHRLVLSDPTLRSRPHIVGEDLRSEGIIGVQDRERAAARLGQRRTAAPGFARSSGSFFDPRRTQRQPRGPRRQAQRPSIAKPVLRRSRPDRVGFAPRVRPDSKRGYRPSWWSRCDGRAIAERYGCRSRLRADGSRNCGAASGSSRA